MLRVILLHVVKAKCVAGFELTPTKKLEPLHVYWHTILFMDEVSDVNDLGMCANAVHCEGLVAEHLDADLADDAVVDVNVEDVVVLFALEHCLAVGQILGAALVRVCDHVAHFAPLAGSCEGNKSNQTFILSVHPFSYFSLTFFLWPPFEVKFYEKCSSILIIQHLLSRQTR